MTLLDEKTRVNLQINNVYAILVSIVTFAVVVSGWYVGINNKLTNIEKTLTKMDSKFSNIHQDVVQNHDDIIVLKGLAEQLK